MKKNYSLLKTLSFLLSIFCFCYLSLIFGKELDQFLEEDFKESLEINLIDPIYSNGLLMTNKGGIISSPQIRIQAIQLAYTHQTDEANPVWKIEAEEELMVTFGEYTFIGKKLCYDFEKKEGVIYQGKTVVGPWFFGGDELQLRPDGSYLIINGYVTTSEKLEPEWGIYSKTVHLQQNHLLKAQDVDIRILNYPVLWIPSFRANLDSIFDSPIRYRFKWGGRQGPRAGVTYEIFSWKNWKTLARFDYRFTRGPGGGLETYYHSLDGQTKFHSINYLSQDSSILHLSEKVRYRFEENFRKFFNGGKTRLLVTFDKISDKDMPNCYYDQDFFIETSYRTQFVLRHQETHWITNLCSRVRVNSFQTVKEELPTLDMDFKPLNLLNTGIIFNNHASASYFNFKYSKHLKHTHNYCSTRFNYEPTIYRPFVLGRFATITPELSGITVIYGETPKQNHNWLAMGEAAINLQTSLYHHYNSAKHVIEPYLSYRYFSPPTSSPKQHYIFDISDGLTKLSYLSFGLKNSLYTKESEASFSRRLFANIYAHAFFNTVKLKKTIPRVYAEMTFLSRPTIRHTVGTAWNFDFNQLDFFNLRSEWTLSASFALSAEYRYRSSYSWRKVDSNNFFLDMYHSENRLLHSTLSDRRDTLLIHFFYRFHPNWSCEFTSRQGWNRKHERNYSEYELNFLTVIQTAWNLRLSFQHQQNDNRVAMYVNVGINPPKLKKDESHGYFFE